MSKVVREKANLLEELKKQNKNDNNLPERQQDRSAKILKAKVMLEALFGGVDSVRSILKDFKGRKREEVFRFKLLSLSSAALA